MCNETKQRDRTHVKQRRITRRHSDSEQLRGRLNHFVLRQQKSTSNIAATSMRCIDEEDQQQQDHCMRRNSFGK